MGGDRPIVHANRTVVYVVVVHFKIEQFPSWTSCHGYDRYTKQLKWVFICLECASQQIHQSNHIQLSKLPVQMHRSTVCVSYTVLSLFDVTDANFTVFFRRSRTQTANCIVFVWVRHALITVNFSNYPNGKLSLGEFSVPATRWVAESVSMWCVGKGIG